MFYESVLRQVIYNQRRIYIEPLIEHIKSVFRIDSLSGTWIPCCICNYIIIGFTISANGVL